VLLSYNDKRKGGEEAMKRFVFCAMLCVSSCLPAAWAQQSAGAGLKAINAITFGGAYNLPAWVAQRQGFFEKHGVGVNITYTPDSVYLMSNLIDGKFDIAMTAIDNLIAYQEGQGEAATSKAPDLVAFMGMDSGFLDLVAAPEIKRVADLRGKPIAVDALTTGFAFVLREMVARAGMTDSDVKYVRVGGSPTRLRTLLEGNEAATLLPIPFSWQAAERGYTILGSGTDLLGHYQGRTAFAQRAWIKENEAAVLGFMRAYRDAMEWIFDQRNRQIAEAILIVHDAAMTPELARRTYEAFVDAKSGLYRNLALDMEGVRTVLRLRSKFITPPKTLEDPMKYIDLELYRKAFGASRP
jgi:ABC-type nitrate/sulfonate/bicarbonate transport system substrate-binding protein